MEINRETIQSDVTVVDEICVLKNKNQQIFKNSVTNVYNANTLENLPRICNRCKQNQSKKIRNIFPKVLQTNTMEINR